MYFFGGDRVKVCMGGIGLRVSGLEEGRVKGEEVKWVPPPLAGRSLRARAQLRQTGRGQPITGTHPGGDDHAHPGVMIVLTHGCMHGQMCPVLCVGCGDDDADSVDDNVDDDYDIDDCGVNVDDDDDGHDVNNVKDD